MVVVFDKSLAIQYFNKFFQSPLFDIAIFLNLLIDIIIFQQSIIDIDIF